MTKAEILKLREAFIAGVERCKGDAHAIDHAAAKRNYPLPMITRPRKRTDTTDNRVYRVVDGIVEVQYGGGTWRALRGGPFNIQPTAARVAIWHDLFTTPTELVEDDSE